MCCSTSNISHFGQVSESGNYTFYVACDDDCELWIDFSDKGHVIDDLSPTKTNEMSNKKILQLTKGRPTGHNQWNKYVVMNNVFNWLSSKQCIRF